MIIDKLKEKFPNLRDLRVREIRVDKSVRKVFFTVSYPNFSNALSIQTRNSIEGCVAEQVPQSYKASIKYVDDQFTEVSFFKLLEDLFKNKFPLFLEIDKSKIAVAVINNSVYVTFNVSRSIKNNIEHAKLFEQLNEFFKNYTSYNVYFDARISENDSERVTVTEQEKLVRLAISKELLKPVRHFKVSAVEKYIGRLIKSDPMYIYDIRDKMDNCTVCGRISSKSTKPSKKNPNLQVCKFMLTDDSGGTLPCVMFVKFLITDEQTIKDTTKKSDAEAHTESQKAKLANENTMKQLNALYDDTEVIVRGKVAFNDFSERLEMVVFDLCKCKIQPPSNDSDYKRKAPSDYVHVKPQVFDEYTQESFADKPRVDSIIKDKKYAVIHVNSTGNNAFKDKIFAICAVKIVNEHIVSRFFTYVNPEMTVDEKLLQQAETTNRNLLFYPTMTEIIGDLYKFTEDCAIIGINTVQVAEMINYYASPVGYCFGNELINQTDILSSLSDNSAFGKKPNCNKYVELAKVCKTPCNSLTFCGITADFIAKCLVVFAKNQRFVED